MSRYQHIYSLPFLATLPYRPFLWQILWATSRIGIELLYIGLPVFARPWEGVYRSTSHELVPTSAAVPCVSGSSNFDSFRYEW